MKEELLPALQEQKATKSRSESNEHTADRLSCRMSLVKDPCKPCTILPTSQNFILPPAFRFSSLELVGAIKIGENQGARFSHFASQLMQTLSRVC